MGPFSDLFMWEFEIEDSVCGVSGSLVFPFVNPSTTKYRALRVRTTRLYHMWRPEV